MATLHGPGEGERHPLGAASEVVIKAGGEQTGGTLYLGEVTLAADAAGPPPHRHGSLHDMFYVLEGTLSVLLAETWHEAPAGSVAVAPPGTVHTFRNDSGAPVRFLNFNTPSGFENYMRELAAAASEGELTPKVIGGIVVRYDTEIV